MSVKDDSVSQKLVDQSKFLTKRGLLHIALKNNYGSLSQVKCFLHKQYVQFFHFVANMMTKTEKRPKSYVALKIGKNVV